MNVYLKRCGMTLACFLTTLPPLLASVTNVLFSDDFSYATAGSVFKPSSAVWSSSSLYTVFSYIYSAGGSAKLGKSGAGGTLTTTNLTVYSGTLRVQVDALGWDDDEKLFTLDLGSSSVDFSCNHDKSTSEQFETFSHDVEVAAGVVAVTFRTAKNKRILLDNILVTHTPDETASPLDFFVNPPPPTSLTALSELSFTITAITNSAPSCVTYDSGLPEDAIFSFAGNQFAWTPGLTQTGTHTLVFSACNTQGDRQEKLIEVTVTALPLSAPQNLALSNLTHNAFFLDWHPVPSATAGYLVTVWSGSTATNTPEIDAETFFEIAQTENVAVPQGLHFYGITGKYTTSDFVELKFDDAGDTLTTKLYPAPVTTLGFRIKGYATSTNASNVFSVYGSADDITWDQVGSYSTLADNDGDDENNIFTSQDYDLDKAILLQPEKNYRRFRFVFETKEYGNIGFAQLSAFYTGSGTRFVNAWHSTPVSAPGVQITGAPYGREVIIRVSALSDTEIQSNQMRVTMPACPLETLFMLK